MIELKITGANIQEFFADAMNVLALVARGGQQPAQTPNSVNVNDYNAAQHSVPQEQVDALKKAEAETVQVATPEPNPPVVEKPTRAKRSTKPPETIDNPPQKPAESDDDPLGLGSVKEAVSETTYTVEDMRGRVKAIIEAHKERGHDMPAVVEYVKKLFEKFDVKLAAEIPPARFAEFIEKSQPYLDGTAK